MAQKKNTRGDKRMTRFFHFSYMWIYGLIFAVIIGYSLLAGGRTEPAPVIWKQLSTLIANGEVTKIRIVDNSEANIYLTESAATQLRDTKEFANIPTSGVQLVYTIPSVDGFREDMRALNLASEPDVDYVHSPKGSWFDTLVNLAPFVLIVVWILLMRGMFSRSGGGGNGLMNVGKARAQVYDKEATKQITFKDVAGLAEAKVEVKEIVDFLRTPAKYCELGAKIPKGALLVGPPGTGKTLLAKAVAGEANVPFLSISGSDFVEMFVGVGASRVRDLFEQAKQKAPCIVFIDEIDAIGRARGRNAGFSGNDERENTLNQLLTEMDGFQTNSGVIVLAATNRVDILDKALMRAGRFDRQIDVGLPDVNERAEVFAVHMRNLKLDSAIDRSFLAKQTPGFSGADIANVCNEAALIAARGNKKCIDREDFISAIDRIVGGMEKRNKPMSAVERRATAIHESGHAVVMWSLFECDPVLKVTIVPRGKSLGATWSIPEEERVHVTDGVFSAQLSGLLGGRIAEQVNYGTLGAGALNDLERATRIAYAMVAYYGMSKKIGPLSFYDSTGTRDTFTKPYSEQLAHDIDCEVRRMIDDAYSRAMAIIKEKNTQINAMADLLLERETIYAEDIEQLLGPSAQALHREALAQAEAQDAKKDTTEA
jgi:cell division protease FtsH